MAQHGGMATDGRTLYGDPGYWDRMNASELLGLQPGPANVRAAGQALPLSTTQGGDRMAQWWHPDSPTFWLAGLVLGTALLIAGASVRVRVGREQAGVSIGKEK